MRRLTINLLLGCWRGGYKLQPKCGCPDIRQDDWYATHGNVEHHKVIIMLIIFSSSFDTEIKLFILDHCHECINRGPHATALVSWQGRVAPLLLTCTPQNTAALVTSSGYLAYRSMNASYKEIVAVTFCLLHLEFSKQHFWYNYRCSIFVCSLNIRCVAPPQLHLPCCRS